jgi:hypothetical protein
VNRTQHRDGQVWYTCTAALPVFNPYSYVLFVHIAIDTRVALVLEKAMVHFSAWPPTPCDSYPNFGEEVLG